MKKQVLCLLIVAVIIGMTACGSSNTQENVVVHDNRTKNESSESDGKGVKDNRTRSSTELVAETEAAPIPEVTDADFEIEEYPYENSIGDTLYYLVVTNNSEVPVSIDGNGTAKDESGNILGAGNMSIDILGSGETSIGYFYFDGVSEVKSVDYTLSYDTSPRYEPVIGNISLEQSINDRNLTVTAKNDGDISAQFVEAYALFFDSDNNVIYVSTQYLTDSDSEIKPGETQSGQLDVRKDFDHVLCYLTGRSNGEVSEVTEVVSPNEFNITEYAIENSIGDTIYYLVIKNNSNEVVSIDGNTTALDANGNTIGAGNCSVDVLGPGETTLTYFYFDNVTGIDKVDYQLSYNPSKYYAPVISDLSMDVTINNNNVVATVTNNGSEPADFVQVHVIFFDIDGNPVYHDSAYVTDDDSEIKPGATLSAQMNCRKDFETVECYLTGRRK